MGLVGTEKTLGRRKAKMPGDTEQEGCARGEVTVMSHMVEC